MYPLGSLVHPRSTLARQSVSTVKRALELISDLIAENYPHLSSANTFSRLLARERLGSTNIGQGVAIPHCRIAHCTHPVGALLQLKEGVNFGGTYDQPIDLIFALVAPEEAHQTHLDALAAIASACQSADYLAQLRAATDNASLYTAALNTAPG